MNLAIPKSPGDFPRHLEYIRTLPCVICDAPPPSEACHLRMGLGGGMGIKPDDRLTIPMCHRHHDEQTLCKSGEVGFWRKYLAIDKQLMVMVMRAFARSLYSDEMTDYGR